MLDAFGSDKNSQAVKQLHNTQNPQNQNWHPSDDVDANKVHIYIYTHKNISIQCIINLNAKQLQHPQVV